VTSRKAEAVGHKTKLMTSREAAEKIGVHPTSLSRRRTSDPGFLPVAARGRGNSLLFRPSDVAQAARSIRLLRRDTARGVRKPQAGAARAAERK
jgi:hypothetical protein